MKKTLLIFILILVLSIVDSCQMAEAEEDILMNNLYNRLPASQEPIELEPISLPTFLPTAELTTVAGNLTSNIEMVMSDDINSNLANMLMNPRISRTLTINDLNESLTALYSMQGIDEYFERAFEIKDNGLYIPSDSKKAGFSCIRMKQYEENDDSQYGLLIKFKSGNPRVLRFVLKSFNMGLTYNAGMEIDFDPTSGIIYCNYKGCKDGHPLCVLSIPSVGSNDFELVNGECYYAFFLRDNESNLAFLTWQENKPENFAYYQTDLDEQYGGGSGIFYKNLSWGLEFYSDFGEGNLDFYLYESYIIACDGLVR